MKFRIPFTIADIEKLKRKSKRFLIKPRRRVTSRLQYYLENADIKLSPEEYKAIRTRTCAIAFVLIYVLSSTLLFLLEIKFPYLLAFGFAFLSAGFVFFSQTAYPRVYDNRRVKEIEKNLIPALQDMLVQLNSGVPLFNIIANISGSSYGALSDEFKKAAKRMNAGYPQIEVLEKLGKKNSSLFFKRTLWQLSNGMRAGSDISIVINESIKSLNEEQFLQIQTYGNKLNPLIMFYLLISVILPALSITFLTILSSMLGFSKTITLGAFGALFIGVVFIQIMFLGMIKSIRPSLL